MCVNREREREGEGEGEGERRGRGGGRGRGREGGRENRAWVSVEVFKSLCLNVLTYDVLLLLTLQCCFEFRSRWILWNSNISQRHSINLHVQYREAKCSLNTHRN